MSKHERESRAWAVGMLALMARRPGITEAEVTALQIACRTLCKRSFDFARNRARKYAKMRDAETAVPEKKEGGAL